MLGLLGIWKSPESLPLAFGRFFFALIGALGGAELSLHLNTGSLAAYALMVCVATVFYIFSWRLGAGLLNIQETKLRSMGFYCYKMSKIVLSFAAFLLLSPAKSMAADLFIRSEIEELRIDIASIQKAELQYQRSTAKIIHMVWLTFSSLDKNRFRNFTVRNQGKQISIEACGIQLSSVHLREPQLGGQIVVFAKDKRKAELVKELVRSNDCSVLKSFSTQPI